MLRICSTLSTNNESDDVEISMDRLFDYRHLRIIPTGLLALLAAGFDLASRLLPRSAVAPGVNRAMTRQLQHRARLRDLRNQRSIFAPLR